MTEKILYASWRNLQSASVPLRETSPLLLAHPAARISSLEEKKGLSDFHLSNSFFNSKWRREEWESLKKLSKKIS